MAKDDMITPATDEKQGGTRVNPLLKKTNISTNVNPKLGKEARKPGDIFIELDKLASNKNKGGGAGQTIITNAAQGKYMVKANELRSGGAYIRKAAEGNVAIPPMGGMPPPPPSEDTMSSDMAKEAKSLGIEVAPPGATAEEVADDQLVLLSEGELVVPANVVRYHGLAQYEKMRKAALEGLNVMDQEGQLVSPQDDAPEGLLGPTMPEGAPV
jgi:hypothetical protein